MGEKRHLPRVHVVVSPLNAAFTKVYLDGVLLPCSKISFEASVGFSDVPVTITFVPKALTVETAQEVRLGGEEDS